MELRPRAREEVREMRKSSETMTRYHIWSANVPRRRTTWAFNEQAARSKAERNGISVRTIRECHAEIMACDCKEKEPA